MLVVNVDLITKPSNALGIIMIIQVIDHFLLRNSHIRFIGLITVEIIREGIDMKGIILINRVHKVSIIRTNIMITIDTVGHPLPRF